MKFDADFRKPSLEEQAVLVKLTGYEFKGREFILRQLTNCRVRPNGTNGSLDLIILDKEKTEFFDRVQAEGVAKDIDGMDINLLLHVDDHGYLRMLEVYRGDGGAVQRFPKASEITAPP